MGRFDQRTVLVTGAASGIGAAATRLFRAEGANVIMADISIEAGEALSAELGDGALFVETDVAEEDSVAAMVARGVKQFGAIDVLFNNAGMASQLAETPDLPSSDWHRLIKTNLDSLFYACRAVIPHMKGRGGAIINTSSVSGLGGDAGCHAYSVTKAAVLNYTRTLAIDHGKDGIRVNAICPGPIATAMTAALFQFPALLNITNAAIPLGRYGQAEEIARVVAFLASDDASFISGAVLAVDGGLSCGSGNPNMVRALATLAD